jgi:hypothetical protein
MAPWTRSMQPAHGSIDFIKRQPLNCGSMTWIKPSEGVSSLLISAADPKMDNHDLMHRSGTPMNGAATHALAWWHQWGSSELASDNQIELPSTVLPADDI